MHKRLLSLLLCLVLVLSIPLTVFAEPDQEETEPQQEEVLPRRILVISDREDFLDFIRACRLDSFSQNLDVTLTADLDLSGADFAPAGIFCGTFDGGGHKISGLEITQEGSVQGLFRYLTQTAEVKNLHIRGEIHPQGSRNTVGALAGSNAGVIRGCSFNGSLSGSDYIGGLVGENSLTGVIQNCRVYGEITGNHFVGGIAGINLGVIRDCTNKAGINTTPQQNTVDIGDVSLQTITGSESANTVTDVGGITGSGSGVIRNCVNKAQVGYRQMGYNVGGIAGSFMGYITDCRNEADVSGRKEVGGIVGHMEPVTQVEYEEDALQILDKQLDELSGLTGQVAADARGGASSITSQISQLQGQITDAQNAVQSLIPEIPEPDSDEPQLPQLPDEDTLLAAQNTLSSALSGMQGSLSGIMASTQSTASNLSQDIQAVADQAGKMGQTINEASENLGGSVTDVSDLDTEEDLTGKIQDCRNNGAVLADLNAGGIVGAMGLESDLDPEEDVISLGDLSLNFEGKLRAVVLNCTNYGQVTAKKQNGGGIAGWMQLGLVKQCDNFGFVECGDYAGGIAGSSQGYVRYCDVKCRVTGETYVGGVAGSGAVVSDCRTMVLLEAAEKAGSILGQRTQLREDVTVERNHYLVVDTDLGGIDGISYAGIAQSMDKEEFLSQQDLPRSFQTISVQFLFEDGKKRTVHLEPGEPLTQEDIPDIPLREGYQASWEDLYMDVTFDTAFRAVYTSLERTVQSNQIWKDGRPVMLIEKVTFQELELTEAESTPVLEEGTVLQAWQFPQVPEGAVLRCLNTEGLEEKQLQMYVLDEQGSWRSVPFTLNGSYAVAVADEGDQGVCLVQMPVVYSLWYVVAAVLVVLDAIVIILLVRKKKGKKV